MFTFEDLVFADGQVKRQFLNKSNVSPQMMLPLNLFEQFEKRMQFDKQFSKSYLFLEKFYELCIVSGFKILPKNHDGYNLWRR